MMTFTIAAALMMQQATAPSDLPPAPPADAGPVTEDVDLSSLKRIYARDSSEASRTEVDHPLQQICVRKLLAGSRVKARTVCQDKTSWIAYVDALEDLAQEWADTSRAIPSPELGGGVPAGSGI